MAGLSLNPTPNNRVRILNSTHVFMMDWMLANPGRTQSELADIIGFDRSWVSVVINSDMFQAMYQERLGELKELSFDEREAKIKAGAIEAVDCIREKLAGKIVNGIHVSPSERFVIDAAKTLLPAAGYSAPTVSKQEPTRHLHLHVGEDVLARSRERMRARFGTLVEEPTQKDALESSDAAAEFAGMELAEDLQLALFEEVA